MNGMDARSFFDDWREGLNKEEKDMTKGARVVIKRICDELMKWCEERHVMCEFATSDDEGLSATFMVDGTTLSVSHIELRDADEFSRYVKSVLFGVDESAVIDRLKKENDKMSEYIVGLQNELMDSEDAVSRRSLSNQISQLEEEIDSKDAYISSLEKEDKEKAKDIDYLEKELEKLRDENIGLKYQLDMKRTEIADKDAYIEEKEKNLNAAADKIVQLTCTTATLKGNIDLLRNSLNKEREGYGELKDQYDTEVTKRMKAEEELENLKAVRHDDVVDVTRYLVVLAKKKRAEEKIRSLKSQVEICEAVVKNLADQNESFKKQVDALVKEKLKILAEDDATIDILKKKNETLQYKIDALENDIKTLISSFKKELEKKDKVNLDLNNNVKDMFATVRSLKKENAGLKDANKFLSVKLEKRDEVLRAVRVSNEELYKEDSATKALNEELKAEIEILLEKNYDLDNHVKNLVAQVEILEREKNELTNEYSDLVKVEEFVKNDTLTDIKERIAWIITHMNNAETEADKRFKKLEEAGGRTVGIDLNIGKIIKDIKERITKLENGTIRTNDMLTGISVRLDKIEKPSEIELNLREVKKDIKAQQELIDALNSLDQRIAWMEDHIGSNENDVARSIEKIENSFSRVDHDLIEVFTRINKLEDAQPKKSTKKTSKKAQISTLS